MPRARYAPASRRRRRKVLKRAKGQRGARSKLYRTARESVQKGLAYAFRDRKAKKRSFRRLWIVRINAACREQGLSYTKLCNGLRKAKITLDRKMLAQLAVEDKKAFKKIVETAKAQL